MTKSILISVVLFFFSQINTNAQTSLNINSDFKKGVVIINDVAFTKKSSIEDYEKVLGKAERIEKVGGKEKIFAYDKLGISLSLEANTTTVQEIYITYIFDGDKKVAKEAFTGNLAINSEPLTTQTTSEQIGKLAGISLLPVMKGLYMSKGGTINLIVYYPESTLGQFGFSFSK
ncbi:MAG: hypothetical protein O9262_01710 [Cyclobacteriaceae bacterium]|nr:hypothetical protein [Cyclobacteriaceae bacterium]